MVKKKRNKLLFIFYCIGITFLVLSPMILASIATTFTDSIIKKIIQLFAGTCASVLLVLIFIRMVEDFNKYSNKIKSLERRIKKLENKK